VSLAAFQCDSVAGSASGTGAEAVWTAVASVCSAVVDGTSAAWTRASALMSAVPQPPAHRCLELAALAAARRVLTFHGAHPDVPITIGSTAQEACPRRLTGATVLDAGGTPRGPSLARVSGPVEGGTSLRLDGFTGAVSAVLLGGVPADAGEIRLEGANSFDQVTLTMPRNPGPGTVRITLEGPLSIAGWVDFVYVASPAGSPSGSEASTTAPGSTPPAPPSGGAASPGRSP
jgi:hypothetical protein